MVVRNRALFVENYRKRLIALLCGLFAGSFGALGQSRTHNPARWNEAATPIYAGIEGIIFVNVDTQLTPSGGGSLGAADRFLELRPALLVGYALTPRFGVEAAFQMLPVATGFSYQRASPAAYIGFSSTYINDYSYVPVRGLMRVLGTGKRIRMSILAGGGPAFTDLKSGLPITPNGTVTHVVTNPNGSVTASSSTQEITHEKTLFAVLEAGLRGSWQVVPRLYLDLTARQLWALGGSVRDISLEVNTPGEHLTATMTTPVRGIASAISIRYAL